MNLLGHWASREISVLENGKPQLLSPGGNHEALSLYDQKLELPKTYSFQRSILRAPAVKSNRREGSP